MISATPTTCLHLPAPVAAVAFGPAAHLGVASEDGTVRVYEPPYSKVSKAVRNLGSEISSLVFSAGAKREGDIWIACEQHVSVILSAYFAHYSSTGTLRLYALVLRPLG
jgi:hypothetical protein